MRMGFHRAPRTWSSRPAQQRSLSVQSQRYNTKHTEPMISSQYKSVAITAARLAGDIIASSWNKPRNVMHKGDVDLVTETDKQCEDTIIATIRENFPDHLFIGEEGSSDQGFIADLTDAPTWIIDPLDGTTNFVHRFPFVCVCIGLAIDKEVVVGVVYNPILNELFTAVRGQGAELNGVHIQVSGQSDMKKALIGTEIGVMRDSATVAAIFDRVQSATSTTRSLRCSGSLAMNLCGVAMGRLDGFWEIAFGGPWDVAAASVILQEAGGSLMDPDGGPFDLMSRRVLAGTPEITSQLALILKACKKSPHEPQP